MRATPWQTALAVSAAAHAAAVGFAISAPRALPPGVAHPQAVVLQVVAAPAHPPATAVRRIAREAPPRVDAIRHLARLSTTRPDAALPRTTAETAPGPAHLPPTARLIAQSLPTPNGGPAVLDATTLDGALAASADAEHVEQTGDASASPARPVSGVNVPPRYPRVARRNGWEGTTMLLVGINARGAVGSVTVAASSGHPVLDEAAREAVEQWRFDPARCGGIAFETTVRVPIVFRLDDDAAHH